MDAINDITMSGQAIVASVSTKDKTGGRIPVNGNAIRSFNAHSFIVELYAIREGPVKVKVKIDGQPLPPIKWNIPKDKVATTQEFTYHTALNHQKPGRHSMVVQVWGDGQAPESHVPLEYSVR